MNKSPVTDSQQSSERDAAYWAQNLKRLSGLLLVWFVGSYGTSIIFVDELDKFSFFGFRLGFWFSQQGSIYIFLALILVYIRTMGALDDAYAAQEKLSAKGLHASVENDSKKESAS